MEHSSRWRGRTAVVTGASAGIGAAVCLRLARAGLIVVGLARRPELVDKLKSQVDGDSGGSIISRACDVSRPDDVAATFQWIEDNFGGVDVMVNNAGVFHNGNITDLGNQKLSDEELLSTIDINTKGTIICSRRALDSMTRRGFNGHIINVNSIAGHYIPFSAGFNVYPSTKHAITAYTQGLLNELATFKSKIKVTSLSPALVRTSMVGQLASDTPALQPADVADAVLYVLSTPPNVNFEAPLVLSALYATMLDLSTSILYLRPVGHPLVEKNVEEASPSMLVPNCTNARRISNCSVYSGDGAFSACV